MTVIDAISPNVPDICPDFVDAAPPVPPVPAAPADMEAQRAAPAHRAGECVPNVPDIPPQVVPDDGVRTPAALSHSAAAPRTAPSAPSLGKWYYGVTLLLAAALGIVVVSQAVSALALAASLPLWAQYTLLVPLGVCVLAVVAGGILLLRAWLRLRAVRQVDMAALTELHSRAQSRADGIRSLHDARAGLERFLDGYPLDAGGSRRLVAAGLKAEDVETLARGRDYLAGRSTDSRSWLAEYRERFQTTLDKTAAERVNTWSLKAAGCVIASPLPLLDAMLVLGISFKMLADLSSLYNVRASRAGCLVLLNRAIVAAFIAGAAEDATDVAAGMASEELAGLLGEGTLGTLGGRVAGVIAPKLGEGAVNAFFIRRLGKAAIRMLQPLR